MHQMIVRCLTRGTHASLAFWADSDAKLALGLEASANGLAERGPNPCPCATMRGTSAEPGR